MNETNQNFEERLLAIFRKLSPERQQQVLDFVEFLIWREQKLNPHFSENSNDLEIKIKQ